MSAPIKLKTSGLKIHNKYTLQLFDTDGQLIQEAFAYNQASARRYAMICLNGTFPGVARNNTGYQQTYYDMTKGITGVHLGTGTGTIDVDSRMYLFAEAFDADISWTRISDFTFNNMHFSASATFPASTSYVGDLTEIGLGPTFCNVLLSHALLVDAENHPIVVQKTSTNILVVTVDAFFTATLPTQPFNFLYDPPEASSMAGAYYDTSAFYPDTPSILPIVGGKTFYFSPAYAPDKANEKVAKNCTAGKLEVASWRTPELSSSVAASFPYSMRKLNCRSDAANNNFGFAHSIVFPGFGTIPLPNESIIPAYNYNGINIGTGDGTTTHWLPAVNEVVSAKVYVDGALTDASFQNFDPRKSPLWNKCIKVEYLNSSSNVFATRDIPSTSMHSNLVACIAIPMSNMVAAQYINGEPTQQGFAPSVYNSGDAYSTLSWGTRVIYYDAAGITLDHFRVGRPCTHADSSLGYTYNQPSSTYPYYLQYSDDGSTWTTAATATAGYITYYFEAITAKYWRLTGGANAGSSYSRAKGFAITPSEEAYKRVGYDQKAIVAGNSAEFDFGKCGINFATAPADGAVITMDAVLNLPYKDNNTVFICSYEAEVPDPGEAT